MKKIIYTLVIVSMLVAAFGVRGVGVQSAEAADSAKWRDGNPPDVAIPDYNGNVDMTTAQGSAAGDQGGCSAVAIFGQYQLHLRDDNAAGLGDAFYRVRVESDVDTGSYQWAVLVRDQDTDVEIVCAVAVGGIVDMVVPVVDSQDVIITITNIGFYVPTDTTYVAYVARFENGGGLIVDMTTDVGTIADRHVWASDVPNEFLNMELDWDARVAFMDLPDGTYNLGVEDTTANNEFAAYYPGIVAPGLVDLTPDLDSVIPLTVQFNRPDGIAYDVDFVAITPNDGGLMRFLIVGPTGQGAEGVGEKTFSVNPGYLWDVSLWDWDNPKIFMVELAFNPTLGALIFDLSVTDPAWVRLCADIDYDAGYITLDPAGATSPIIFQWDNGTATCPVGYSGGNFILSANVAYETSELIMREAGWDYEYLPAVNPWNFPGTDASNLVINTPSYDQIVGDVPFLTTPMPNATSQELYTLPLAAGEVALLRGPWTDQDGNMLVNVTDTNPATDVEYAPEYWIQNNSMGWGLAPIANDWDTTDLGPITDVGRYEYYRGIYHGPLVAISGGFAAGWFEYYDIFAIQPADMSMMTDWSWSWVMAMYEYDLTTGLNGGGYAPNAPVTRAQMAAFLARTLDLFGLAPTGVAPAFADVPAAYWASAEIAFLRDYGITTGTDWCDGMAVTNSFCPNANVTRAEMAKFIEVTFRTIKTFAGVDFYWPEEQNIYIHGITFIDVPVDYWANVWIEEFFFDQLTDGCMRDGLNLYYCPGDEVTRGQMAKFIIRAIQPDFATQGFWPILAPSK